MSSTVALIHAVQPAMPPMKEVLSQQLPEVKVLNMLDEGLLSEVERYGGLAPQAVNRLATDVGLAIEAGASAVLLTCNAYTPVVGDIQARFPSVPVMAVDQVMVDQAVAQATRIGVLATVPAGLEQQSESLRRAAEAAGKQIELVPSLHPDAMAALQRGDPEAHDRILLEALPELARQVDVVLLAQASMARVAAKLPPDLPVPVLTSPLLAVEKLRSLLSPAEAAQASRA